jgi:hypothetical protein
MSELCNQCALAQGFVIGDFVGRGDARDLPLKPGAGYPVVCAGCGYVKVDEKGNCLGGNECTMEHHKLAAIPEPPTQPHFQDRMRHRQRVTREQHRRGQEPPRASQG